MKERKVRTDRALRGGRLTIPVDVRRQMGIGEGTLLQLELGGGEIRIKPVVKPSGQGSPWLEELYEKFAPVREEVKTYGEAEINAAIDQAVKAVRGTL